MEKPLFQHSKIKDPTAKYLILLLLMLFAIFSFAQGQSIDGNISKLEDDWNGIKMFKTTRSEVEKLYKDAIPNGGSTLYRTENAMLHITYSVVACSQDKMARRI